MFDPLDFLAEFTQHIPPKGAHLVRYYGWYSNKARGMRRKAAEAEAAKGTGTVPGNGPTEPTRGSQTWAMLIKRVYEVDPLKYARCGGEMKVVAFIEPPRGDVIEKILRHCGLWDPSTPRAPPSEAGRIYEPDADWKSQPISSEEQESGEPDVRRHGRVPGDRLNGSATLTEKRLAVGAGGGMSWRCLADLLGWYGMT